MKPTTWAMVFALFAGIPISAQRAISQGPDSQPSRGAGTAKQTTDDLDAFVRQYRAKKAKTTPPATLPACKDLETTGIAVDKLFAEEADPILSAMKSAGQSPPTSAADNLGGNIADDRTWDILIDCANQTQSESERAEALRVAAMWEGWRAEWFAKQQREARPVHPDSCDNLDQLMARVKTVTDEESSSAITHPLPDYDSTADALWKCVNDAVRLSKGKPDDRYWSTVTVLSLELWEARRTEAVLREVIKEQANGSDGPSGIAEQNSAAKGTPASASTADDLDPFVKSYQSCDQVITVAGLTPNGLALYIPPEGQRFMAKNAKDYPRMCLVEETNAASFARGVPHYLLVWAYSENAFAGFQPVQQVTTSPVYGSGTVTNFYGDRWNFTYSGSLTEIDTVEAPYVQQSRTLYLWAYDGKGRVVSRHSISTSSQAGGDASYAAGYNAGALISLLWNNPSRLIKGVLKDVQKASGH